MGVFSTILPIAVVVVLGLVGLGILDRKKRKTGSKRKYKSNRRWLAKMGWINALTMDFCIGFTSSIFWLEIFRWWQKGIWNKKDNRFQRGRWAYERKKATRTTWTGKVQRLTPSLVGLKLSRYTSMMTSTSPKKPQPENLQPAIRKCLMCSTSFQSRDIGERVCPDCKTSRAWRDGY